MNSKVYLYDGSFNELLDLISKLLKLNSKPLNIYKEEDYQPSLLDEAVKLELNNPINASKAFWQDTQYGYAEVFL